MLWDEKENEFTRIFVDMATLDKAMFYFIYLNKLVRLSESPNIDNSLGWTKDKLTDYIITYR